MSKLTDKEMRALYRTVFSSPEGQQVLMHICKKGRLHMGVWNSDPVTMAHLEGMRHMALSILKYASVSDIAVIQQHTQLTEHDSNDYSHYDPAALAQRRSAA